MDGNSPLLGAIHAVELIIPLLDFMLAQPMTVLKALPWRWQDVNMGALLLVVDL